MSQATRTLVTLAALLAVAAGVGLYAYYGVQEKDVAAEKQKEHDTRLFSPQKVDEKNPDGGTVTTEFVKIVVVAKGETSTLEREPGHQWRLTAPVSANVDKLSVDALVSQLQTAKFKGVVDESPDDAALGKYGLKSPEFSVEATAEVGDSRERRSSKLVAGIENTFDGSIFMQRNGEKQVFAAEGGARWALAKSSFDLRDKELLAFDEKQVQSIAVNAKINKFTLARAADKSWQLRWQVTPKKGPATPVIEAADPTAISGIFGAMKGEKATGFPADSAEARAAFGLEKPTQDLTFTLEGEQTVRVRISSFEPDAGGKTYLLRESDGGAVLAEMNGSALSHLERNPADLRDKSVLPFKKDEVTRAVFHVPGEPDFVAERAPADAGTADSWRITAPRAGPAKVFKIASVLWTVGSLKATKVVDSQPKDLAQYGMDAARGRSVALFAADGKSLGTLQIGKTATASANAVFLKGTRDEVVEADGTRLADLPTRVEDLLDEPAVDGGAKDAGP